MSENQEVLGLLDQAVGLGVQYGLNLIGAIVLLIGGWIVAGWARRGALRALDRVPDLDKALKSVIANVARYAILILVVIAVLAGFGVETTGLIAVVGTAGLAIGLALQGTLQNIAAGIMLLFQRPFGIGDYIDADGLAGSIDEIGLFTTRMHTYDGIYMQVPNARLWNHAIKNYSRLPTRRLDIIVGISYADDIDKAQAALMDLLENDARALGDPAPQVTVSELAESSVNLNLRCWTERGDYWGLRFDLNKATKQRLDAEGITIPFPQRDVHLIQDKN